jgi:hypothetical protein
VQHLADPLTDEVFARIRLQPDDPSHPYRFPPPPDPSSDHSSSDHSSALSSPSSFAKTLTPSDANNGGGFSVPRYCAETIFPRLDYRAEPPIQIVAARDAHGALWRFRHIYRGTPRRHLLTTGWSSFVSHKRLVAGDAVVFVRSSTGAGSAGEELCIGIRRLSWAAPGGGARVKPTAAAAAAGQDGGRFHTWRTTPGHADFLEALASASSGRPFEALYFPRRSPTPSRSSSSSDAFCVDARAVHASLRHPWSPGMRFKMAVETEDASRVSWFMGTVAKVQDADPILWPNSPWKMLQVRPSASLAVSLIAPSCDIGFPSSLA